MFADSMHNLQSSAVKVQTALYQRLLDAQIAKIFWILSKNL